MSGDNEVGVIGLGLIGGSVAKVFRAAGYTVWGWDQDPKTMELALASGILANDGEVWTDWIQRVRLVFVATPIASVIAWLDQLGKSVRRNQTVVELSSVKAPVIPALTGLPAWLTPLSLHPMAGRERSGFAFSSADLFRGFPCAVVRVPGRSADSGPLVQEILGVMGMAAVDLEATAHDMVVAAVSHLPYLVSAGLLLAAEHGLAETAQWSRMAGPGFLDTTRVGSSDARLWQEITRYNQNYLTAGLDRYITLLQQWRQELASGIPLNGLEATPTIRKQVERGGTP